MCQKKVVTKYIKFGNICEKFVDFYYNNNISKKRFFSDFVYYLGYSFIILTFLKVGFVRLNFFFNTALFKAFGIICGRQNDSELMFECFFFNL